MLQEYSRWRVAQVFFGEPLKDHYLREISRKAELSHTSVKKHLKELKEFGIIEKREEEKGERVYPIYKARLESKIYKFYKKLDLIYHLRQTGLIKELEKELQPDCIILFGSGSRGEDTENSDIDLFLQSSKEELELSEYEKELNRTIQLHIKEDFNEYPEELKNNIINGITLYGFLEVFE